MFESLMDRIEMAVDDPAERVRLRAVVADAEVSEPERERLVGLLDRFDEEDRLEDEAAETESVVSEELGDAGA